MGADVLASQVVNINTIVKSVENLHSTQSLNGQHMMS